MIINGNTIAADILASVKDRVAALPTPPRLAVFTCAPNFETQKFLALKQRRAAEVGIALQLIEFDREVTLPEIVLSLEMAHSTADGIIVQLPFPARLPVDDMLVAVQPTHDVDVMTYDGSVTGALPPVVGAIDAIARQHDVAFAHMQVTVVGRGKLVGIPSAVYARARGAEVVIVDKDTPDAAAAIAAADILILGAGVPGLVTADMVKSGVVVFDAGTSEVAGVLAGDAHPAVADVASLYTPVPGGIGPITVAILLQNVLTLMTDRNNRPNMV